MTPKTVFAALSYSESAYHCCDAYEILATCDENYKLFLLVSPEPTVLSIDSSTKRIIVYKRNIQYQNVVLEINNKNSATTIFRSCVTVRLEQHCEALGRNNRVNQQGETTG